MKRLTCLFLTICLIFSLGITANALSVEDAVSILEETYVDVLPPEVYQAQTLDEVFRSLGDEYTYYMTAEEYTEFLDYVESETSLCGIGISANITQEGVKIAGLLDGGSAAEAGLIAGDYIIAVDGVPCVPAKENTVDFIKGEEGTFVTVTVLHADGSTQDYKLERRQIVVHNTNASNKDGITTITCDSFGSTTDQYFADAVTQYNDQTRLWKVDLRGNGGGVAQSAAYAIGEFSGRGPVLFYRDREKNCSYHFYTEAAKTDAPVIVFVDGGSASASEIFAAGIRGTKCGIVVGSRSYGKGVAQIVLDEETDPELFDGDCMKITAYRFYTADRSTTDRIGVIPTLLVSPDCADPVAALLCAPNPEDCTDHLLLTLNETKFYLDLSQATAEENLPYFKMLLEALPQDAEVKIGEDGAWKEIPVKNLQERYGVAARTLPDVAGCDYDFEVDALITYGIINGDENGLFRPKDTLTRAELCAMIAQAFNVRGRGNFFADVAQDSWYASCINAAALLGLVNGDENGNFRPDEEITYDELITVMGRLAKFANFGVDLYADDLDEKSLAKEYKNLPEWARPYASVLTKSVTDSRNRPYNMLGTNPANVNAKEAVTREIAVSTLFRVLKYTGEIAY